MRSQEGREELKMRDSWRNLGERQGNLLRLYTMWFMFFFISIIFLIASPQQAAGWASAEGGGLHSLAIQSDGSLWAWGNNNFGQVGDGTTTGGNRLSPLKIGMATDWAAVAAGYEHSLALKTNGTLWSWGYNSTYQLGIGIGPDRMAPGQVGSYTDWFFIAGGYYHNLALKSDGTLWAWGYNADGQLGNGSFIWGQTPTQIGTDNNWIAIAANQQNSLGQKSDGSLYAWGDNSYGQLGIDDGAPNKLDPTPVALPSDPVKSMAAGNRHGLAVLNDGTLWAWGDNQYGQLGDNFSHNPNTYIPVKINSDTDWTAVAAGFRHSLALKTNGTLWAWGDNQYGQLGDGTIIQRNVPTQIGMDTDWVSIDAGQDFSLARKSGGSIYAWGMNGNGQLGDGTTINRLTPTQVTTGGTVSYQLTYTPGPGTPGPGTGGTIDGSVLPVSQTVSAGGNGLPVKAIPFPGYTFTGWIGDINLRTDNPRTDIDVAGDISVTANFSQIDTTNTLLTMANPPGGTYNTDQTVTLAQVSGPSGSTIYYTTDGNDPTTSSASYPNVPIPTFTTGTKTLKFATYYLGTWEPVKTEVYSIVDPAALQGTITTPQLTGSGNIPVTITFPDFGWAIKPDCVSNTHFELYPCDLSSQTCDPLPSSLCRQRKAYGPDDVYEITSSTTLDCNVGDMYDPSILNQLTAGPYTVTATYSTFIPINPYLDDSDPTHPKTLKTGAIDITPVKTNQTTITLYKFTGFLPPVDNPPVWNIAKAGQTIPVKWQVEKPDGPGDIYSVVNITGKVIMCPGDYEMMASDVIDIYDDSQVSLLQCSSDGTCQYDWKTSKDYANKCYALVLKLTDGTERKANFLFKSK
jgi:uncharacterized repeat protein (TIGR02543 family)